MKCDKCRCAGRVTGIKDGEAHYVCANPRCLNYRREFGKERVEKPEGGKDAKANEVAGAQ